MELFDARKMISAGADEPSSAGCGRDKDDKEFCMKKLIGSVFILLTILFTGCVATNIPPMDRRVTVAENLGADVYVTDVRCAKGRSDHYTYQANVVNNTGSEIAVEWKVVWLDSDGIEIDSLVSTWSRMALGAKEIRGLKGVAPRPDAVDMRFYVRKMR